MANGAVPAAAADDVKLPAFERTTLTNGAQVALLEKRDTPLVSMSVKVRGGALGDPAGKEGTAALFADLVQKGEGSRSAEQFDEAIENVGGELGAGAVLESLSISATFWPMMPTLLELVADALLRPHCPQRSSQVAYAGGPVVIAARIPIHAISSEHTVKRGLPGSTIQAPAQV
jgi:predicted Zn-dependent peptidase